MKNIKEKQAINVISVENMRLSDLSTIQGGIPSLTLMKNAAKGILNSAHWNGTISIVAGSGNNGGDGFALACELSDIGIPSTIFALSDNVSTDSDFYKKAALQKNIPIHKIDTCATDFFKNSDIIVDCIFGTGFHGEVKGLAFEVILAINDSGAYVISADINSGVNGDTGIAITAVKSDLTVSIGQVKNGFFIGDAPKYIGSLINAYIGIEPQKKENYMISKDDFALKYNELKYGELPITEYTEMPQETKSLAELTLLCKKTNSVISVKTEYTAFLADSSTVWIQIPQNYLLPV